MVRLLRAVPVPLSLVAMITLAGVVLGRVYAGPQLVQLVSGAAFGSVAVSVAARRLPSWLVGPLSMLALTGYAVAALRLAAQIAELPGAFGDVLGEAARNGIPRLLTAMIPVEPVPDTLLVPLVTAWLTGLAATELALRSGRLLLAYGPPTLLYAGALYVVGPNAEPARWPTLAFVASAVIGLAATGRPATMREPADGAVTPAVRARWRARTAAGTAGGVAAVIALAVVVAPAVAERVGTTPVDPRRYVQPPQVDSLDENPLVRISGWALNPDQKLFDVTTRSPAPAGEPAPAAGAAGNGRDVAAGHGMRIRLAVLHDYDGVTWRVGGTYRNAGRILPPASPSAAAQTVEQEVTIAELTGRLLPVVPTPEQVAGTRVAYDAGSGTLIRPEGLAPGLRYTVTSARERPDPNLLSTADVPAGDAVARVLSVGEGVPEQMRRLAEQLATDNGAPFERAVAIEQFLATHYRVVADAPSGHAYQNLAFFLFGPRNGGGQRGTSEQFAAAFAVLGRLAGLPSRVVVGFHSATGSGPVRGADAYAWPEVFFTGVGWVPFDPMPQPDAQPRPVEEDFAAKPESPTPPPTEEPAATISATAPAPAPALAAPERRRGITVPVVVGGATGVLALGGGGFALVVLSLRRAQRRRRLGEGSPAQRVAGAWWEVIDALRLDGRPAADHLAAAEVAVHAAPVGDGRTRRHVRPPVPPIDDLATLVNRAAFAPYATGDDEAGLAAARALAYASGLRARRPWWRRLMWSVHPGPLLWHRRPPRGRSTSGRM